jgi:hypothetical protein
LSASPLDQPEFDPGVEAQSLSTQDPPAVDGEAPAEGEAAADPYGEPAVVDDPDSLVPVDPAVDPAAALELVSVEPAGDPPPATELALDSLTDVDSDPLLADADSAVD